MSAIPRFSALCALCGEGPVDEQDTRLIERCRKRDVKAYETLYHAHAGRVAAYFLRSGFAHADADDLTQETFVRAFRSLATFDAQKGTFRRWLAEIARNVARSQWGRRKQAELFDAELAEEMLLATENPSEAPEAREELAAVGDCVGRLPEELWQIVRLRYVVGRTLRGVAASANMPEATVRLRLQEALALLARCLKQKGVVA